MSTWKAASRQVPRAPAQPTASLPKRPPAPLVDVVSLAIDADENPGGDPYNHTGQFCVVRTDESPG